MPSEIRQESSPYENALTEILKELSKELPKLTNISKIENKRLSVLWTCKMYRPFLKKYLENKKHEKGKFIETFIEILDKLTPKYQLDNESSKQLFNKFRKR